MNINGITFIAEKNTKCKYKSTSKGVCINYLFLASHSSATNKNLLLEPIKQCQGNNLLQILHHQLI